MRRGDEHRGSRWAVAGSACLAVSGPLAAALGALAVGYLAQLAAASLALVVALYAVAAESRAGGEPLRAVDGVFRVAGEPAAARTRATCLALLLCGMVATSAVNATRSGSPVAGALWPLAAAQAALTAIGLRRSRRRAFGTTLTPAGVRLDSVWGGTDVPWSALDPARPARVRGRAVFLTLVDPAAVVRSGFAVRRRARRLAAPALGTDPAVLAAAVDRYATRPDRRAAIGSAAELAALPATAP